MDTTVRLRATAMRARASGGRIQETVVEMPRQLLATEPNATWSGEAQVFEIPLISKVHARFGADFGETADDKKCGSLSQNVQQRTRKSEWSRALRGHFVLSQDHCFGCETKIDGIAWYQLPFRGRPNSSRKERWVALYFTHFKLFSLPLTCRLGCLSIKPRSSILFCMKDEVIGNSWVITFVPQE